MSGSISAVTTLARLSTGQKVEGPKSHKAALKRLRAAPTGRSPASGAARPISGKRSAVWRALYARVANIRRDATHKADDGARPKTYRVIGIEDLNVRGMAANRRLARSIMDGGFFELRRQPTYKTRVYGSRLAVADRWRPSSKTCSCCGVIKPTLALSQRTFNCDDCGFEADRDVNAAIQEEKPVVLEAASHVLRNQQRFQNGESQLPTTPEYAAIGFVGLGRNDR